MIRRKGVVKMCIIDFFYRLVDAIDTHPWIANLCGIFISAGVAIWVMNHNNIKAEMRETNKLKINDEIEMNISVAKLSEMLQILYILKEFYRISDQEIVSLSTLEMDESSIKTIHKYIYELLEIKLSTNHKGYKELQEMIWKLLMDYKTLEIKLLRVKDNEIIKGEGITCDEFFIIYANMFNIIKNYLFENSNKHIHQYITEMIEE